jgi:threonine dehydrogenase-like Zn-dependent dehydrogenase
MSSTVRSLFFVRKGRLEWRETPRPTIRFPHEALVRPIAAARCDGDCLFLFHNVSRVLQFGAALHVVDPEVKEFGQRPFAGPFAYGHECVAEVVEVGEAVRRARVGQRVVVPFSVSCGECPRCRSGLTAHCVRRSARHAAYGFGGPTGGWGGAVSDLLHVPFADGMLVPVPENVSAIDVASASDNIPDAWRCVAPHLEQSPGAPVLVVGGAASSIGLYAAGIAVALGSERVDYVDTDLERLAIAELLGANPIRSSKRDSFPKNLMPRDVGYPIVVDASSRERGLDFAVRSLSPGGACTAVGYYFRTGTKLPLWHMYMKGVRLEIGITNARAHIPELLRLVASGRFRPGLVCRHVARWNDAPDALLVRDASKVVVARDDVLSDHSRRGNGSDQPGTQRD